MVVVEATKKGLIVNMKIVISIILFFAVMCGVAPRAHALQLKNSSFEDSGDPDDWFSDSADHWGRWGNWINRETGWSPTCSGQCIIGYHNWRIKESTTSGIYQDIPDARAGDMYTFSIYAIQDPGTNIESVELRLEELGGGAEIASSMYKSNQIKHKWTLIRVAGRTAKKGLRVVIVITPESDGQRSGAVKFDDAHLLVEE